MSFPVFVVDTNVVVAGLLTGSADSAVVATLDAMLTGSVLYLLSPELVNEYRLVLLRQKLRKLHGLDEAAIEATTRRADGKRSLVRTRTRSKGARPR